MGCSPGRKVCPGATSKNRSSAVFERIPSKSNCSRDRSQVRVTLFFNAKVSVFELPSVTTTLSSVEFDQPVLFSASSDWANARQQVSAIAKKLSRTARRMGVSLQMARSRPKTIARECRADAPEG